MHRTIRLLALPLGLATLVAAEPFPAVATPKLYHSPGSTGLDPAVENPPQTPFFPLGGSETTVYLFLDPGPSPTSNGGTTCDGGAGLGGNGDETCGLHFEVRLTGDLSIVDFNPEVGIAEANVTSNTLSAALVTTGSPLPSGPTRIGTMEIDVSGPSGGRGELDLLETVDADLEKQVGTPRTLFVVPEPGFLAQLASGLALLTVLARFRGSRKGS